MELKDKAQEIRDNIWFNVSGNKNKKEISIILIKHEYKSNRELLFNLKSSGFAISDKVYLSRLQGLIDEENALIEEIKKM